MRTLRAFHGSRGIKDIYLERVRAHRAADEIIRGESWRDGKGGAVGCTIHGGDHDRYEVDLGIPASLSLAEQAVFEALPIEQYRDWPVRFLDAIPVGADLTAVPDNLLGWIVLSPELGIRTTTQHAGTLAAIDAVAALYARREMGAEPKKHEWIAARDVVDSARAGQEIGPDRHLGSALHHAIRHACNPYQHDPYRKLDRDACVRNVVVGVTLAAQGANAERIADQLLSLLSSAPIP